MSVNVPLLRKYVEWVEEQETRTENREWWQFYWAIDTTKAIVLDLGESFCGTAFCLAGKIATDHGWRPVWDNHGEARLVEKAGEERAIADVANDLLGIGAEHHSLFVGDNTAADIRQIAEHIAGERL